MAKRTKQKRRRKCGCVGRECGCGKDYTEQMELGWLWPYLQMLDGIPELVADEELAGDVPPELRHVGSGRWAWWIAGCLNGRPLDGPIPQVRFQHLPRDEDKRRVKESLQPFVNKGYGWYDEAWLALKDWILFGLGYGPAQEHYERIPPEISNFWYRGFSLEWLMSSPCDWSSFILQGGLDPQGGRHRAMWSASTGFYATPMNVCTAMTQMLFMGMDPEEAKMSTLMEPCCGTGIMLLPASNYTCRMFAVDIVAHLVRCTALNSFLWMPWMVWCTPEMEQHFALYDRVRKMQALLADAAAAPRPGPDPAVVQAAVALDEGLTGAEGAPSDNGRTAVRQGIHLATDPAIVEATEAYRRGDMTQTDFLAVMGVTRQEAQDEI